MRGNETTERRERKKNPLKGGLVRERKERKEREKDTHSSRKTTCQEQHSLLSLQNDNKIKPGEEGNENGSRSGWSTSRIMLQLRR